MARIELEVETVAVNHGQEEPEPDHEPYSPTAGFDQKLPETEKNWNQDVVQCYRIGVRCSLSCFSLSACFLDFNLLHMKLLALSNKLQMNV